MSERQKAVLVLDDGKVFNGYAYGAIGTTSGEVVFNTSMVGYQEIITDPSYSGQLVCMTYPHIGNYGVNMVDVESMIPQSSGLIVREGSPISSNWRAGNTLERYLAGSHIVGIQEIDTRALTRHIREHGAKRGIISSEETNPEKLRERFEGIPEMTGLDLVQQVTCQKSYIWKEPLENNWYSAFDRPNQLSLSEKRLHLVVIDCGVKRNILRWATSLGFKVTVVPAFTASQAILDLQPDAVLVSNGPGDPEPVDYVIKTLRELIGQKPIFGICLGHQLLGLAIGGSTFKLKFGHHGGNHPVKNLQTGKVEITSQNHGFAVDPNSLKANEIEITHINLNDQTLEGFRHRELPVFSVQYHPEASPGPHDAGYLFQQLQNMVLSSL
ncbi:MAG: glutamine-hydrolyzing carbamoyl-phosphate synthase small subunit [Deferribacteres bacterium]|nr:glutamine-hydrolyzing carbamoyl-phosphate synthase small subunit [candidate division KSB1 bacterium]MCB9512346.1 glutamine-hydrolyzing carbamoyl-phosphate synthase small subunit [Deferribacteres bacterium]